MKVTLIGVALIAAALAGCGGSAPPAPPPEPSVDALEVRDAAATPKTHGKEMVRIPVASPAAALKRIRWEGKTVAGSRFHFSNAGGGNWDMRLETEQETFRDVLTEVAHSHDYVELVSASIQDVRLRLCKDKLIADEKEGWIVLANGGWVD